MLRSGDFPGKEADPLKVRRRRNFICCLLPLLLVLAGGCGEMPRLNDGLQLPLEPGRLAVPDGYFRSLTEDLARDLGERRSLDRFRFLPDEAWPRWERLFQFLFNVAQGMDLRVTDYREEAVADGWRIRFDFQVQGFTAVGRREFAFRIPVDWRFRLVERTARLEADGLAALRFVEIHVEAGQDLPLEGVRVERDGQILTTTDDSGRALLLLEHIRREELRLVCEGFEDGRLEVPAGSREISLPDCRLQALPGAFLPPVEDLRLQSGDRQIRLRWHYPHAVDRYLILRRDNGHFRPLIELPGGMEEFLDSQDLVNGRRSLYRIQPGLAGREALIAPVVAGIPSAFSRRLEWEELLLDKERGRVKGATPWIERSERGFHDTFLCLHSRRTERLTLFSPAPWPAGVYAVFFHARKEPRGGRLRVHLVQFGDTEGEHRQSFVVDLQSTRRQPVRLELGQWNYRPVNWQDNPLAEAVFAAELEPLAPTDEGETLAVDALELIRLN